MMTRRNFLTATVLGGVLSALTLRSQAAPRPAERFEVEKSEDEWRKILTPQQFAVLRKHETERSGSSPLNNEHRTGLYDCAGCALPLFSSATKFESGTGWPSFYEPLPNAVRTAKEGFLFMARTEVHCRRCGGHLGHVFDDGPPPTGKRYCMNGAALTFVPAADAAA